MITNYDVPKMSESQKWLTHHTFNIFKHAGNINLPSTSTKIQGKHLTQYVYIYKHTINHSEHWCFTCTVDIVVWLMWKICSTCGIQCTSVSVVLLLQCNELCIYFITLNGDYISWRKVHLKKNVLENNCWHLTDTYLGNIKQTDFKVWSYEPQGKLTV